MHERQLTQQVYRQGYAPSSVGVPGDPTAPRDRLTGRPLDEKGRYSQTVVLDGEAYEPKYHPCATAECVRTGANLDMSDPETQAYVKALDAQVFKDVGKGITIAGLGFPTGGIGGAMFVAGTFTSLGSALTDSSFSEEAGKFIAQNGAETFFREVLGHSPAVAGRAAAMIELSGGWDAFVQRAKKEL